MEVVYYIPRYYVISNGHFTHRSNFYEGDVLIIGKSLETKLDGKSKRSMNPKLYTRSQLRSTFQLLFSSSSHPKSYFGVATLYFRLPPDGPASTAPFKLPILGLYFFPTSALVRQYYTHLKVIFRVHMTESNISHRLT